MLTQEKINSIAWKFYDGYVDNLNIIIYRSEHSLNEYNIVLKEDETVDYLYEDDDDLTKEENETAFKIKSSISNFIYSEMELFEEAALNLYGEITADCYKLFLSYIRVRKFSFLKDNDFNL